MGLFDGGGGGGGDFWGSSKNKIGDGLKTGISTLDPSDVMGYKAKKRQGEYEQFSADNKAAIDSLWADRPTYNNPYSAATEAVDVKNSLAYTAAAGDIWNLRTMANSTGDSPYALAQKQMADYGATQERDSLAKSGQSAMASGMGNLAVTGGLEGGAATRLAMNSQKQNMMGNQGIAGNLMQQKMGIGAQDAQFKQGLATQLPGMGMQMNAQDLGRQQFNSGQQQQLNMFNTNNEIGSKQAGNIYELNKWQQRGNMLGSSSMADAQYRAGNKGGMIEGWVK